MKAPVFHWFLGPLLASAASAACAQSCVLPVPFQYEFQNGASATLSAPAPGDPCALSAALNPGARSTAAAFLHYRRATPLTSVRFGFRLDTSGLVNYSGLQFVQIFSASSPTIIAGVSNVFGMTLRPGGSYPQLIFSAARGTGATGTTVALAQNSNVVRVEINVGAGTAGNVRYWINHAFSDPPDGTLDNNGAGLDNGAFQGVIAAGLGLASPTSGFSSAQAGNVLLFDQIESSDDVLFYDDFSSGAQ